MPHRPGTASENALLAPIDWVTVTAEAASVRAKLLEFPALSMLGNLVLHACWAAMKTDAYEFPQIEYAALVYWHEPSDAPDRATVCGAPVEEIATALNKLFFTVQRYYQSEVDRANGPPDQAELGYRLRSAGLGIRVPAYDVHQHRVLRGIFGPYETEIKAILGFNLEDVIASIGAMATHYEKAVPAFQKACKDKSLSSQEAYDAHFAGAGNYLAFDGEQVSTLAGLPAQVTSSVLEFFALPRGDLDQHALLPSPFSKLRAQPILAIGDGRYFVPSHALLLPAVQPRLEQLLNPAVTPTAAHGLWTRYEKHRGKWVEEESYRLLQRMVPGGQGMVGAYYFTTPTERVEGDLVYQADDVVFLLEGKAGAFTPATLRGAAGSLSDDVTAIIAKGHDQCARTEAYIQSKGTTFENADRTLGATLTGTIREVIRIVITLDNVGVLATASAALQRAGYLQGDPTWVLSLTDLMILADVLSQPGEFRHYARERYATLLLEHVLTHDETDYLGMYLLYNQTTIMEGEADTVMLTGHMEQFDNHYVKGIPKEPPHQKLPAELEMLIQALAHKSATLWSQAVCDVLKLGENSRDDLATDLRRLIRDCAERPRDVTAGFDGNRYLTILLGKGADPDQLRAWFIQGLTHSPNRLFGKRLFIGYDPASGAATAEYYERVDDRHFRVPPALTWSSSITRS